MIQAVIHTHSFYATLWSCAVHKNRTDCIPQYTPYLKMKLGTVGLVPYGKPGSEELFPAFRQCVSGSDGFLLENHGPIVGGKNLLDAFYCLEELEESARMAWEIEFKQGPLSFRKIYYTKENQLTEIMSRKGDSHATMCCNRR